MTLDTMAETDATSVSKEEPIVDSEEITPTEEGLPRERRSLDIKQNLEVASDNKETICSDTEDQSQASVKDDARDETTDVEQQEEQHGDSTPPNIVSEELSPQSLNSNHDAEESPQINTISPKEEDKQIKESSNDRLDQAMNVALPANQEEEESISSESPHGPDSGITLSNNGEEDATKPPRIEMEVSNQHFDNVAETSSGPSPKSNSLGNANPATSALSDEPVMDERPKKDSSDQDKIPKENMSGNPPSSPNESGESHDASEHGIEIPSEKVPTPDKSISQGQDTEESDTQKIPPHEQVDNMADIASLKPSPKQAEDITKQQTKTAETERCNDRDSNLNSEVEMIIPDQDHTPSPEPNPEQADEDDDVPLAQLSTKTSFAANESDATAAELKPRVPTKTAETILQKAGLHKKRSLTSPSSTIPEFSAITTSPNRSSSTSSINDGENDFADVDSPEATRRRSSSSSTDVSSVSSRKSSLSEIFGSFRESSPLFRTFTTDTSTTNHKNTNPRQPSSLGKSAPVTGPMKSPIPYEEPRRPLASSILPSFWTGGSSLSSSYSTTQRDNTATAAAKRKSASGSQIPSSTATPASTGGTFSSVFRSFGVPSFGSSSSSQSNNNGASSALSFLNGGSAKAASTENKDTIKVKVANSPESFDPGSKMHKDGIIRAPMIHESPRIESSTSSLPTDDDESAFVMARLHAREATAEYDVESGGGPTTTKWISDQLSVRFQFVKESLIGPNQPLKPDSMDDIDWDFWGKVINDYENVVRKQPRYFTKKLHQGIPEPIRGMMWQLMSKSKSESLESKYLELLTGSSRHEKVIQRDLARTFPGHEFFKDPEGPGQTSLFNVLKAYSIYDQEVGYCQGIAFIVGPLLLNMPEEQAFCVLVRLMQDYGFRDLYGPKMIGLQLRNHQFDKLLEEQFPAVYRHLNKQDVKSTMYASQWFMTLFAYRFPLPLVFRVMDILFAEGSEAVLRFALALIKHNADTICSMDFEPLLEFLKSGLFDLYVTNTNQLVSDASAIRISKTKLDKWATEYTEEMRKQSPEVMHAEALKAENRKWYDAYQKLEMNYETLNKEHIDLATRFLEKSMQADQANDRLVSLEEQIASLKTLLASDRKFAEEQVKDEMDQLAQKNMQLIRRNAELQEEIGDLEERITDLSMKYANAMSDNEELSRKLDRLRRALGA